MLFRVVIALFVLINTLQGPTFVSAKGGAQVNAATPTQPEVTPVQMPITGTTAQPAIEEPQAGMTPPAAEEPQPGMPAATQPAAEEPPAQPEMAAGTLPVEEAPAPETTPAEMPRVGITPITPGEERMRTGMMQRIWNAMGRPTLTTNDREMLRNVVQQMRGPRRIPRRSGKLAPSMETLGVATPVPSMPETPMEPQQPTMEQPMTGAETQPAANVPVTEQPMPEPPLRETEEEATPAASEMSVRGARFNTAVGDIDISNAVIGSEEQRTVPRVALRNVDFNTFVGRLRAGRTEIGRGAEPQWHRTWMPRRIAYLGS